MQPSTIGEGAKRTKGYEFESLWSDEDSADEPEDMSLGPRGPPPKRVKRGLREYRGAFEVDLLRDGCAARQQRRACARARTQRLRVRRHRGRRGAGLKQGAGRPRALGDPRSHAADSDRTTVEGARRVFDSLFKDLEVRISNTYELRRA